MLILILLGNRVIALWEDHLVPVLKRVVVIKFPFFSSFRSQHGIKWAAQLCSNFKDYRRH